MANCINTAPVLVCFTAADGTKSTLLEHVIYENGISIGQAFTTVDDTETIFDVSTGTITGGACPIASPDVEWEQLCDIQADGSSIPFFCRTITYFDANGDVIVPVATANFELDKVTDYTVVGTVGQCPDCQPVGSLGTITDWTALG